MPSTGRTPKWLPFYFVGGELDGGKMADNARDLDRYLQRGYNVTVVEYLGRGHEHFYDEILRLFDWMGRLQRDFFPREFTASTMRPLGQLLLVGGAGSDAAQGRWSIRSTGRPRGHPAGDDQASITATNGLRVRTGAGSRDASGSRPRCSTSTQRVNIVVNGRRVNPATVRSSPTWKRSWKTSAPGATASIRSGPRSNPPRVAW